MGKVIMITLIILVLMCGNSTPNVDLRSIVSVIGEAADTTCIDWDLIDQNYFSEVAFVSIDTSCLDQPITPNTRPATVCRMALDAGGNTYRLFNLGPTEFNQLIDDHPVDLSSNDTYDFGKFFIEMTQLYDVLPFFYIANIDELKTLNKENLYNWLSTDETISAFHESIPRVDRKIDSLIGVINYSLLLTSISDSTHYATYYIWTRYNGSLQKITLEIGGNGKCSVVIDDTLAVGVGYFDPLNRGVTER